MDDTQKLKSLMRSYRNRQCVLFVGAGFSATAKSNDLEGKEIDVPSGRRLVEYFKKELGEDSDDLSSLADLYEDEHGEHGLYGLLKAFYVVHSVMPAQQKVSNFNWKEVYTTNYDNVIEVCLAKSGKKHAVYTPLKQPAEVDYRTLPIIHPPVNFVDFKKEIKLTDSQYFSDDFSRSPWGGEIQERHNNVSMYSICWLFAI
ncbi:hypothetical protein HFO91_18440 [Rhizobium leguminosarum]|uniref:hypothetical protein n=1 Tax=Rhizobium leguminosarum TaxID=384 RepID=UPI001C9852DA|nr:hypothetical protein [Rhizobium leguminosarum]MBY5368622.1 hypothetical protein [Rhizobium leguminosarum]MBY5451616.1 hypothetical protein [Rhizobium leguminosarum]